MQRSTSIQRDVCGVLVVDDDPGLRRIVERILHDNGYRRMYSAEGGTEALSILAEAGEDIHVLLTDLRMPGMDGMALIRHLINVHTHPVGVVMLTGFPASEVLHEFYELGSDWVVTAGFLVKPVSSEELLRDVDRVAERICTKRAHHVVLAGQAAAARLDRLEAKLDKLELGTAAIEANVHELIKRTPGFLSHLGLDLIRALILAMAILAILHFGLGDLLRSLLTR